MAYSNTGESYKPASSGSGKGVGDTMYHISGETAFDNSPKKSLVIKGAHSVGSLLISSRVRNQLIAAGMETLLDLQERNPVEIVGKNAQTLIHEILSVAFGGRYKPKWSKE